MTSMPTISHDDGAAARRPVVEAAAVTVRYGPTVALQDVGLTVDPGETHALVGRNGAGKSTLVAVLTGLRRPDDGVVRFAGEPAPALGDRATWRERVACVYQHSTVVPELTVAENLFLNRQPTARGAIRWRALRRGARALLDEWEVGVDPDAIAGTLSVEATQLVEIARSLSFGARFIILDEPTAQLDGRAIDRLFARLRALQAAGVTFLYISHHLQEIYEVCDRVTVLRDARWVATEPVSAMGRDRLVEALTGEPGGLRHPKPRAAPVPDAGAEPALRVEALSGDGFEDVSLAIDVGEVVALAGTAASGKAAVAETIAGLRRPTAGEVHVAGRRLRAGDVGDALDAGLGFVPEDRHREGLVIGMSIAENASMTVSGALGRGWGTISPRRVNAFGQTMIERLGIKASDPAQPVSALSGGNQQKVVMARALANDPSALVMINPTAGVDVKSKEALLEIVDRARDRGAGALIVSDELDDLRSCDRVLVLRDGRVAAEFPAGWDDTSLVASIEGVDRP